jgi:hypothetical protein
MRFQKSRRHTVRASGAHKKFLKYVPNYVGDLPRATGELRAAVA